MLLGVYHRATGLIYKTISITFGGVFMLKYCGQFLNTLVCLKCRIGLLALDLSSFFKDTPANISTIFFWKAYRLVVDFRNLYNCYCN